MERPGKQQQDPRIASAMDHVLAAENSLQVDLEAIREAADGQLAEARLNARRVMERAEQRTADVHRRGKRQLEREVAKLKRAAAAETPAAEADEAPAAEAEAEEAPAAEEAAEDKPKAKAKAKPKAKKSE